MKNHPQLLPPSMLTGLGAVPPLSNKGLFLPFPQGRRWVALLQIVRLEGVDNYTYCHFSDAPSLLVALSLKVFSHRVPAGTLIRSHRKHLLYPLYIEAVSGVQSTVLLTNGERIPIARRRVGTFRKEWRENYHNTIHGGFII